MKYVMSIIVAITLSSISHARTGHISAAVKVTPQQEAAIKAVQKEYLGKRQPLNKQLKELRDEEASKIEAILSGKERKEEGK